MNFTNESCTPQSRRRFDITLEVDAYLPWSGGSRTYYHQLYKRLVRNHGLRVLVRTTHSSGDAEFDVREKSDLLDIRRKGLRFPDWKAKRLPQLAARALGTAASALSCTRQPLHCGDLFPQDLACALVRRVLKAPLLIYVHGDEISQTEGRRVQPHVRNVIYRSADVLVAANNYARDRLLKIVDDPAKVVLITPGVDFSTIHPGERPTEIRDRWSLGDDLVIMTVGRLVMKKGHGTILRSLPRLRLEFPRLKYMIVGDGPERRRLEQMAYELGLAGAVHFVGDVPNEHIGDYYRAADVVCMINQQDSTGDVESFGMVFIEANATAKPVVGGRSGGTAQSVLHGETGYLCEPGNDVEVRQVVARLLRDEGLRHRMGEAGLIRARNDFDWDDRASQLADVHARMMQRFASAAGGRAICSLPR